jgi:hypothetical protein
LFLSSVNFKGNQFADLLPLLLGIFGGYLIPAEDSTEKALWDHGGECEESFEGIYIFSFFVFLGVGG